MAITPIKALLFLLGGSAAATATAYVSGAFDTDFGQSPPQVAELRSAPSDAAPIKGDRLPGEASPATAPAAPAPPAPAASVPAADTPASETPLKEAASGNSVADAAGNPPERSESSQLVTPQFDVVRVESDGSMVIAGRAGPRARIDAVAGANVIGTAAASAEGDFAIILDKPLDPGDYQISLRSTGPGEVVASSDETAIVSVPEEAGGEVLAMVEEPGKPSELISIPEPANSEPVTSPPTGQAATPPAAEAGQQRQQQAGSTAESPPVQQPPATAELSAQQFAPPPSPVAGEAASAPVPAKSAAVPEASAPTGELRHASPAPTDTSASPAGSAVVVEAVEIEGRMVFVAGTADPGRRVRVYADSILLGDALASPQGRFLVEAERDLPVGDYVIRVDALDADGATVVARAAVPFEREPGETLAAVAPAPDAATFGAPAVETLPDAEAAPIAEAPPAPVSPATAMAPTADASGGTEAAPTTKAPPALSAALSATAAMPAGAAGAPNAAAPAPAAPEVEMAASNPAEPASPLPAGEGEVTAPKLQSVDGAVIIRRGDSLWRISRRVYGRGTRYSTIYLANREQIRDPDRIWPGQVFKVPGKSNEGESADMGQIGSQATTLPATPGGTAQQ